MRYIKRFEQRMEDWIPSWDERVKIGKCSIRSTEILWNKTFELCKGAKHPQYNSNFMNKIGGNFNTVHPPTTIAISHFQFILFLFFGIVWKLWSKMTSWQYWFNLSERALYFHKTLFVFILFLSRVAKYLLGTTLLLVV